jgi:tRNA(fMet)-specific endonuclease VapC
MKYLLHTNICIYLIKKKPPQVLQRLSRLKNEDVAISSITLSELEYGIQKSSFPEQNKLAVTLFLLPFTILSYDDMAAESYGVIRTDLEKKGIGIGSLDTLIAAHALSHNLTLVTNNEKEFSRIRGLKVENWVKDSCIN